MQLSSLAKLVVLSAFAFGSAQAAERRFEPVPQSSRRVQHVDKLTILVADGTKLSAGASITAASGKRASLSLSVKNLGSSAVDFGDSAVAVTSGGETLEMRRLDPGADDEKGYMQDKCANASATSKLNCNIDSFTNRQHDRVAAAARDQLAPGQLATRQFQLVLPKPDKQNPLALKVTITLNGEAISFDFQETP